MLLGHFLNLVPQVPSGRKLLLSQGVNTFWNLCSPSVRSAGKGLARSGSTGSSSSSCCCGLGISRAGQWLKRKQRVPEAELAFFLLCFPG